MLVLSRHEDQHIMIGDSIVVTVVRIEPGRVRLGITAPDDVPIRRDDAKETRPRSDFEADMVGD